MHDYQFVEEVTSLAEKAYEVTLIFGRRVERLKTVTKLEEGLKRFVID